MSVRVFHAGRSVVAVPTYDTLAVAVAMAVTYTGHRTFTWRHVSGVSGAGRSGCS